MYNHHAMWHEMPSLCGGIVLLTSRLKDVTMENPFVTTNFEAHICHYCTMKNPLVTTFQINLIKQKYQLIDLDAYFIET